MSESIKLGKGHNSKRSETAQNRSYFLCSDVYGRSFGNNSYILIKYTHIHEMNNVN